jgi:hypothetical protein
MEDENVAMQQHNPNRDPAKSSTQPLATRLLTQA